MMEEKELLNKAYSYLFYVTAVLIFIASIFFFSLPGIIISAVLLLLAAVYYSSGHIINNLLIKRSNVIEIYNGYSLSSDLLAASRRIGSSHMGIAISSLTLSKSSPDGRDSIKSILDNLEEPFEFCIDAKQVDKKAVLDALETKRRMKEIAISKINSRSYDKLSEAKRELNVFDGEIESIRDSGRSFQLAIKLKARAIASNESEACSAAYRNLEKVSASFSSVLGLEYEVLKGEALLDALEGS